MTRVRIIQFFLVLASVGGLVAVTASLSTPSMDRREVLLGYSSERIFATLVFSVLAIALSISAVKAVQDPRWVRRMVNRLDVGFLNTEHKLLASLVVLLFLLITTTYLFFLIVGYGVRDVPYPLQIAFERFAFPIVWVILLCAGLLVATVLIYGQRIRDALRNTGNMSYVLLVIVLVGTSIHWITLLLRTDFWFRIPGWSWPVRPARSLGTDTIYILVASLIGFFIVRSVLQQPRRTLRNVILCIGLAYALQIGFGFARGDGYESIRSKYSRQLISDEVRMGCASSTTISQTIRQYETLYGDTFWLGTKPPGLVVFYQTVRDLFRIVDPGAVVGSDSCFRTLTTVFAITLPLVASLVVIPLYGTERLMETGQKKWYVSSFLYMSAPSFLLMPLLPDQFLFPLLFMTAVFFVAATLARRSFILGFVSGGVIYLSIFVSFSLLPLLGLVVIWLPLESFLRERKFAISRGFYLVSAVATGIGTFWLVFLFIGYDPIARYVRAFNLHRMFREFDGVPASILQYAHLNNVEFALWAGWPLFVLMILGSLTSVILVLRQKADRQAVFAVSLLATYVLLNLAGQTRGEVGRLWIFLLPAVAIIASIWATKLLRDPIRSVLLVFTLQLGTSFLAFLFLDFR